MKMRCCPSKRHYYDMDKFNSCPYCKSSVKDDDMPTPTISMESYDDEKPTISLLRDDAIFFPRKEESKASLGTSENDIKTVSLEASEDDIQTVSVESRKEANPVLDSEMKTESYQKAGNKVKEKQEPEFWSLQGNEPGETQTIDEENNLTAGWLVCVEGGSRGRDYRIVSGKNMVGREYSMPICVQGDEAISRVNHCAVIYDDRHNVFYLMPVTNTVSMNGINLEKPVELKSGDEFIIGNSRFVFVAFCMGDRKWTKD